MLSGTGLNSLNSLRESNIRGNINSHFQTLENEISQREGDITCNLYQRGKRSLTGVKGRLQQNKAANKKKERKKERKMPAELSRESQEEGKHPKQAWRLGQVWIDCPIFLYDEMQVSWIWSGTRKFFHKFWSLVNVVY